MQATQIGSAGGAAQTARARGVDSMKSEDFFRLLVTELQQQDPLEPTKTADMIGSVSRIRSIEQTEQLGKALDQMVAQQRTAGTSDLLGKLVQATVTDSEGNVSMLSGVVTAVRIERDGTAMLELDTGQAVRAVDVTNITMPDNAAIGGNAVGAASVGQAAAGTTSGSAGKTENRSNQSQKSWLELNLGSWK